MAQIGTMSVFLNHVPKRPMSLLFWSFSIKPKSDQEEIVEENISQENSSKVVSWTRKAENVKGHKVRELLQKKSKTKIVWWWNMKFTKFGSNIFLFLYKDILRQFEKLDWLYELSYDFV